MRLWLLIAALALGLAACSNPPYLSSFSASPSILRSPQGGTFTLDWQGSIQSYVLTISSLPGFPPPPQGILVNGSPYTGPVILKGSSAQIIFPPLPSPSSSHFLSYTYILTLTAGPTQKRSIITLLY